MDASDLKLHVWQSLMGFYKDGGLQFWSVFDETPRAAMAVFKDCPEYFGAIAAPYSFPKFRAREHARLIALLERLLAEHVNGLSVLAATHG